MDISLVNFQIDDNDPIANLLEGIDKNRKGFYPVTLKIGKNVFLDKTGVDKTINLINYFNGKKYKGMVSKDTTVTGILYKNTDNPDNPNISTLFIPKEDQINRHIDDMYNGSFVLTIEHADFNLYIECIEGSIKLNPISCNVVGVILSTRLEPVYY